MRYPKKLEKGATIGIICPSSPISAEREVQCVSVLQEMGFKVKKADNLTKNYAGYMAQAKKEQPGSTRCSRTKRWTQSSVSEAATAVPA